MIGMVRRFLLERVADSRMSRSLAFRVRLRRWELFTRLCSPEPGTILLDVGGLPDDTFARFWEGRTVRVNLTASRPRRPGDHTVVADARALPFRDRAFRVAFSNSLLEHVGDWVDQQEAAAEIRRVADRYFVQVPDRSTPLEPHYLLPFFQFLPERWQRRLHRALPIGWLPRDRFEKVRLLSVREMQGLFPDARILRERILWLPKSCYAVRGLPTE